jgi:hypothetical protein
MNAVRLQALHRAPPPPQQPTMSVVKLERGPAASVKLGQKSFVRSIGIITLSAQRPSDGRDEARLRRGHNDQLRRGHQSSETTLTGESQFHISTPPRIELGSLMTGSKELTHWTSETVYECSEMAGSPQVANEVHTVGLKRKTSLTKAKETPVDANV